MTVTTEALRSLLARGTVSDRDVSIAAALGEPAALPLVATLPPGEARDVRAWLQRLRSECDEARRDELCLRVAIGAARGDLAWTAQQADYTRTQPGIVEVLSGVLEAIDDWIVCACERHLRAVAGSIVYLPNDPFTESVRFTAQAVTCGTQFAPKWGTAEGFVRRAVEAGGGGSLDFVLPTILREVAPWVLHMGDPVRDRVAARGRA